MYSEQFTRAPEPGPGNKTVKLLRLHPEQDVTSTLCTRYLSNIFCKNPKQHHR